MSIEFAKVIIIGMEANAAKSNFFFASNFSSSALHLVKKRSRKNGSAVGTPPAFPQTD